MSCVPLVCQRDRSLQLCLRFAEAIGNLSALNRVGLLQALQTLHDGVIAVRSRASLRSCVKALLSFLRDDIPQPSRDQFPLVKSSCQCSAKLPTHLAERRR
jgi:hypothetical protein